jgi:hypothetical protein
VTEPQRYFFLHIPKTAGMVMFQHLARQFGDDAVYPQPEYRGRLGAATDTQQLERDFRANAADIRVVVGHFPLCAVDLLGVPFSTFTILRDPVERTLSLLRQHQQRDERYHGAALEDVYADPVLLFGLIHNYMVKVLSMTPDEMTSGALSLLTYDDAHLERAQHNLEHRIEVFGLQESFDEFRVALASHYGWDLGGSARYENRTTPVAVSDEFRARIAHDNRYDVELYRFAPVLLRRRHQTIGT